MPGTERSGRGGRCGQLTGTRFRSESLDWQGSHSAPPAQAHTAVAKTPAVHSPLHASRRLAHRMSMDVCAHAAHANEGAGQTASGPAWERRRSANRRHGRGGRDVVCRRLADRE